MKGLTRFATGLVAAVVGLLFVVTSATAAPIDSKFADKRPFIADKFEKANVQDARVFFVDRRPFFEPKPFFERNLFFEPRPFFAPRPFFFNRFFDFEEFFVEEDERD